eukprot:gene569-1986_t
MRDNTATKHESSHSSVSDEIIKESPWAHNWNDPATAALWAPPPTMTEDGKCFVYPHSEFWGDALNNGNSFKVASAGECCTACSAAKEVGTKKASCNVWVWCGDKERCGAKHQQCWLKWLAYAEIIEPAASRYVVLLYMYCTVLAQCWLKWLAYAEIIEPAASRYVVLLYMYCAVLAQVLSPIAEIMTCRLQCWLKWLAYAEIVEPAASSFEDDVPWTGGTLSSMDLSELIHAAKLKHKRQGTRDGKQIEASDPVTLIDTSLRKIKEGVMEPQMYHTINTVQIKEGVMEPQMYHTINTVQLLHSGHPDNIMDELPTFVTDPMPESVVAHRDYQVLNRPYALANWIKTAVIPEKYILMAEPDHIYIRPLPNFMRDGKPAAYNFGLRPTSDARLSVLDSPRTLSPGFTKDSQSWIHLGLSVLDSPRTLSPGFTHQGPQSWHHQGSQSFWIHQDSSPDSPRTLSPGFTKDSQSWIHQGLSVLDSPRTLSPGFTKDSQSWIHQGLSVLDHHKDSSLEHQALSPDPPRTLILDHRTPSPWIHQSTSSLRFTYYDSRPGSTKDSQSWIHQGCEEVAPMGNSPTWLSVDDMKRVMPIFLNVSINVHKDHEAQKEWGWVQEMYAYTMSVWLAGIRNVPQYPHIMAQPPWDRDYELLPGRPYYIIHYTYGLDFDSKTGEVLYSKVGDWHFDKRQRSQHPINRNWPVIPAKADFPIAKLLIDRFNEATAAIPCWDEYEKSHTRIATGTDGGKCEEAAGGVLAKLSKEQLDKLSGTDGGKCEEAAGGVLAKLSKEQLDELSDDGCQSHTRIATGPDGGKCQEAPGGALANLSKEQLDELAGAKN